MPDCNGNCGTERLMAYKGFELVTVRTIEVPDPACPEHGIGPESVEQCAWFMTYPGYDDLGEQCPDEAVDGQPYCAEHGRLADG